MKNFFDIFIHPFKYFENVKNKEKMPLWMVFILFLIIGVLTGVSAISTVDSMGGIIAEDQMGLMKNIMIVTGTITATLSLLIGWVIRSGVLYFIVKKMGGISTKFSQTALVVGVCYFPKIFQTIINIFFPITMDAANMASFDWISFFVQYINIFNMWQICLTIIGLAIINEVSYKKTAIAVIGLEVVTIGISLGTTLFSLNLSTQLTTMN